jgi:hypothetical protein
MGQSHVRSLRSLAGRLLVGIIAMAIALTGGLSLGSGESPNGQGSMVCSVISPVPADVLKVGDRLEPRVPPAPLERIPTVSALLGHDVRRVETKSSTWRTRVPDSRAQGERFTIVKHVPRMERGDPPRV